MAEGTGESKRTYQNDSIDIFDCNAIIASMATLTIRNLPDTTKQRLRIRAAERGHSMEEEARVLIERGLAKAPRPKDDGKWVEELIARMRAIGDAQSELIIPEYEAEYTPVDFSKHGNKE